MKPARDISRLLEIMAALRDPQTGCPWDIEQNFRSITPYTIEEVYEVVDAIERDDMENLQEELGDLLLQVVYHAQMAQEDGHFDFADVVQTITSKMIRRHPHVFGDEKARTAGMAKGTWEKIKAEEKAERKQRRKALGLEEPQASLLNEVPNTMPAVLEAVKLQHKASQVGFDWHDPKAVLAKIREELDEFETELDNNNQDFMEAELGDVFFALANLGRHLDIDPESAIRRTNNKFRNRFSYIEQELASQNQPLKQASLEEMETLWQQSKTQS